MKIVNISPEKFDQFALNHSLGNYYQSSAYASLMSKYGFKADYIGIIDNSQLIGASLILNHQIFMGFKYGYAPRGILMNYLDYNTVPYIIKKIKRFLFNKSYLILKIDPLIIVSTRNKQGEIIEQNVNIEKIISTLKKCNLVHCGFNNYMESIKPRWHAILNIQNKNAEDLSNELNKNIRNKIKKAAKFGIEIVKDNSNNIEKIYDYIKEKGNYSLNYYQDFKKAFKDEFEIYYAKINTELYVENSKFLFEKETEINDYINDIIQNEGSKGKDMRQVLNKKMESDKVLASYKNHLIRSTKLLKEHPDEYTIGGAIVINHNNTVSILIEGYEQEYKNLCPGFLLKWRLIEKYCNSNINFIDMNAISGDFSEKNKFKGLNESKLGYNSKATEYVGEFNLIVNKPMYSLYRNTKNKYSIKNQKK